MSSLTLVSRSSQETEGLGRLFGSLLTRGSFVALRGELGSGKTCFTRGIVAGAAPASAHLVASPTFAIMNEYPGSPPVYHFDFYRLAGAGEIAELGFEEYFLGSGICVVEWSERLHDLLPDEHVIVSLVYEDNDQRTLTFEGAGPGAEALLSRFAELTAPEKFL